MPPSHIQQVLTFNNVAALGTATQNHTININGTQKIPSRCWVDNGNCSVTSLTSTQVEVTNNNGAGPETVRVWLEYIYSSNREFGGVAPFEGFIAAGGVSGGGSGSVLGFTHAYDVGTDGTDFFVTLPYAWATDDYVVTCTMGGTTSIVGVDCPNIVAGDRTTTTFRVILTAELQTGDDLDFIITDRTV